MNPNRITILFQQLVAANEKLEAAVKRRQQQDGPHLSDSSCQCDLTSEHYEQLLSETKQQYDQLNQELSVKVNQIDELASTLSETRSSFSNQVTGLKETISALQVPLNFILTFLTTT